MPAARFTREDEDRLIAQYLDGASLSTLGKQEDCCLETIRKMLRRRGVSRRPRGGTARSLLPDQRQALIADYNAGLSQIPLAKKYGVSQASVSRYLRSANVKMRLYGAAASGFERCGGRVLQHDYMTVKYPRDGQFASMRNHLGYMLEHRLVMAQHLGRPLTQNETVHHKDGDKLNNAIENLELRQGKHGKNARYRCAACGSLDVRPY